MEHQGTKTIETERLILRKFTADDLSAIFHNWTSDEKVTEFLRWPTHKSIDITKRVLESWLLEYEKPDFYQWAIIPKEIGEPIGTISVIELNEESERCSHLQPGNRRWIQRTGCRESIRKSMRQGDSV
jgi:[ribosomal protein S5]-alanine N-acetyltransferase